jgi:hypothetical protein
LASRLDPKWRTTRRPSYAADANARLAVKSVINIINLTALLILAIVAVAADDDRANDQFRGIKIRIG